jgi:glucans biosynthesis protein
VTSLRDRSPAGFGLAQRARAFDRYLDLEAQYHRRPGVWVEIGDGDWGSGGVELLTIPTESEFNDNVAAYWVSDEPFRAGDERHYRYRLITFGRRLGIQTLAQVDRSRSGWDALPGQRDPPPRSRRRFVVDFSADDLPPIDPTEPVRAVLETSGGETSAPIVQTLPDGAGWRATFVLTPDRDRPADMRLFLELDGRRLTETWSYVWYPARVT